MHCYKGTNIRISAAASRYLTDYRRIGRYVYVTEYNEQAVRKLMSSTTLVTQVLYSPALSNSKRIGLSIGEFLKVAAQQAKCGQVRRATAAEYEAYTKVRTRYFKEWMAHEMKDHAARTKRVARYEAQLAKTQKNTEVAQLRSNIADNKRALASCAKRIAYCREMLGLD